MQYMKHYIIIDYRIRFILILLHKLLPLNLAHEFAIIHDWTNVRQLGLPVLHLSHLRANKLSSLQILVPIDLKVGVMTKEFLVFLGGRKSITLLFVEPLHLIHLTINCILSLYSFEVKDYCE
jgi:hypothetical protein